MVAFRERTKWCFDCMFMRGRKSMTDKAEMKRYATCLNRL